MILHFTLALLIGGAHAASAPKELTAQDLLKGSKVPERREFPLHDSIKPCENFHTSAAKPKKNLKYQKIARAGFFRLAIRPNDSCTRARIFLRP